MALFSGGLRVIAPSYIRMKLGVEMKELSHYQTVEQVSVCAFQILLVQWISSALGMRGVVVGGSMVYMAQFLAMFYITDGLYLAYCLMSGPIAVHTAALDALPLNCLEHMSDLRNVVMVLAMFLQTTTILVSNAACNALFNYFSKLHPWPLSGPQPGVVYLVSALGMLPAMHAALRMVRYNDTGGSGGEEDQLAGLGGGGEDPTPAAARLTKGL